MIGGDGRGYGVHVNHDDLPAAGWYRNAEGGGVHRRYAACRPPRFLVRNVWPLNIADMREGDSPIAFATAARVVPSFSIRSASACRLRRRSRRRLTVSR